MKKRIVKVIKTSFLLGLILSITLYIFIINSWKFHLTKSEFSELIIDIKQAEKLPEKFYQFYNIEFNKSLENGILKQEFNSFISDKNEPSISLWISKQYMLLNYNFFLKNSFFTAHSLALKIEKETTRKENLNWMMKKKGFLNSQNGIKLAAKYYFNKKLFELNDIELANLVIISKNPSLYNPNKRQKLINQKVSILMDKITMTKHSFDQ